MTRASGGRPRVAIAHDYLTQRGGAERVVLAMLRAFPEAKLYTTLYDQDGTFPEFRDAHIITSPIDRVKRHREDHRMTLPLLPWAVSRLHVDADVVIASSSGWAHGVPAQGRKLVYCHAPARWLYQAEAYLGHDPRSSLKGRALLALSPALRKWDRWAAATADRYLVNSTVVRDRVKDAYGIDAEVVHPPFGVDPRGHREPVAELADWAGSGYHLLVSRLLPYKNVTEAVAAFDGLDERLLVVGHGPLEARLRAWAPKNVRIISGLVDSQLRWAYAHATALIAPSLEDYGLTPLEAGAFGRPTLALGAGGYLDTVAPGVSGTFFAAPTAVHIREAVLANRARAWNAEAIRSHVDSFSEAHFHARLIAQVETLLADDSSSRGQQAQRHTV